MFYSNIIEIDVDHHSYTIMIETLEEYDYSVRLNLASNELCEQKTSSVTLKLKLCAGKDQREVCNVVYWKVIDLLVI